jgi:hypothetical protein
MTWEECIEESRETAYENFEDLKNIGGRPSREINPDPGPCPAWKDDIQKKYHSADHWNGERGRTGRELERWLDFRWHQVRMRQDSNKFDKYKDAVYKHQQAKGINWTIELQLDQQTKLDEWWEYYIYEHRKRRALEMKLNQTKKELEPAKKKFEEAKRNGSVGIPDTVFTARISEIIAYDRKILHAQKEVEMAQKRLEVVRVEESISAAERNMWTKQAEDNLESAHKSLEAEQSEELAQLNRESLRSHARQVLASAQGKVNYANTLLRQLDTLLECITGHFAEIAADAPTSWWGQHNRDLLDGWERYYVYMRERLQEAQKSYATANSWMRKPDASILQKKIYLEGKEERFKALWAFVEREFPEIAAKLSNDHHQNEIDLPYSKPSPSGPACKTSRSDVGKDTRRKGRSAREPSPLSQVQPSKVSKPGQRKRRSVNQKLSTARHGEWPPKRHTNNVGRVDEQKPPKVAVRRSERISQQTRNLVPPSLGSVQPPKSSSRRLPEGTVRRSARILDRTKKIRSPKFDLDVVKHAQSSTTAERKSSLRTMVHTNTAYTGTPQGISKTRRKESTSNLSLRREKLDKTNEEVTRARSKPRAIRHGLVRSVAR